MDKRWSFKLNKFYRLGGFTVREKVFCFLVFGFRRKGVSVSILYFFESLF